ncbi:metal ABC transporter ATP-binding protein [candidate division WOR-3 bacterium]|nr:metal ABC transporter ATP-binding protein [candidate division WOR-3 bacterium]MCK4575718.1 metal ABC transporter ATP-binding protein [candidate division WOR-3 bacterium]
MDNSIIVDFRNVFFSYNTIPVLENINFQLYRNDFLAIIGPNGGGKTTILKLMLGLLKFDKGSITIFGKSPLEARKSIGYLPQHFTSNFDFPINVLETVLMGRLGKRGIGKRYTQKDIEICLEVLQHIGMEQFKNTEIGKLSGGQRQRVFIARALATKPKLLLLDEPVSSIDMKWEQAFYKLLHELNKEIAIILVTHDISVISMYIDKIACINRKLFYHGSKKEGMHKISEMYEYPVQIISHETSHSSSGEG